MIFHKYVHDTLLMGSHETRAGEQNLLSDPPGNTALSATQDTADFMDCKCTLLSHIHYLIHQYPQVLLHRVAFNPLIAYSVFVLVIFPVRCRTLNLVLLPFMMFFMGPPLKCVLILLHSTPSLQPLDAPQSCISPTSSLSVC